MSIKSTTETNFTKLDFTYSGIKEGKIYKMVPTDVTAIVQGTLPVFGIRCGTGFLVLSPFKQKIIEQPYLKDMLFTPCPPGFSITLTQEDE